MQSRPINLPRFLSWRLSPLFTGVEPIHCIYLVHDASFMKLRFVTLDPLEKMDFLAFAIDRETNRILQYSEFLVAELRAAVSYRLDAARRTDRVSDQGDIGPLLVRCLTSAL